MKSQQPVGAVIGIKGPIVVAAIQPSVRDLMVNEVVYVGDERLIGETSSISEEKATIQVYEDTTGLERGAPLYRTRELLSVQLGPGLLGSVYDGLQRPLERIAEKVGAYVRSGVRTGRLPKEAIWEFT
ncbi:MAG: V-type ATP synthase subunit A, partial [Aigarchaeota archaeon]|nr:V-type ATP synthase subunit A [Aigarchaeota archaeon]